MILNAYKVKTVLAERDMTHRKLSELSGLNLNMLDSILAVQFKEVRATTINKICSALDMKPEDISVPPDEYRDNLLCRYAKLVEQQHELERKGLVDEASVFQSEIEEIKKSLA